MKKRENEMKYKMLINDLAESVSFNENTADSFFKEENINIDHYVSKGIQQIHFQISAIKSNSIDSNKQNPFFKRVVLAAEIASNLYNEPTFGHVKFQKLVYLSEKICEMKLLDRYTKEAAGPFDRKFMHSIDSEFKRLNWFQVEIPDSSLNVKRYRYIPLEHINNQKKYYHNYFSKNNERIHWLINTFRETKTDNVEVVATIYACIEEISEKKLSFSIDLLIELFYNWSERKKNFSRKTIIEAYNWMKENELVPY